MAELYQVCLRTGDSGSDATGLHAHENMLGDVYVGPYVTFGSATSFSLINDDDHVVGYGLSVFDTEGLESECNRKWWPEIQSKYSLLKDRQSECWLIHEIFNPSPSPKHLLRDYPSHGHIDLLPATQGIGFGRKMMEAMERSLTELGSPGFHLRVSPHNARALKFYSALNYQVIDESPTVITVGKRLNT